MTDAVERAAQTPMSDHVARFWKLISAEYTSVTVKTFHSNSDAIWSDDTHFSFDAVKAIAADRVAPAAQSVPDEPMAWQWKHTDPVSGNTVWRDKQFWNGHRATEQRPLYTRPQPAKEAVEALEKLKRILTDENANAARRVGGLSVWCLNLSALLDVALASLSQEQG